jgi:hypothetical protein
LLGKVYPTKRLTLTKRESDLVLIQIVQGEMTAQIIKAHLESEGIPVLLQHESLGGVYGFTVDGLGEVKILVPKEFVEEAKQILKNPPASTNKE